MIRKILCVFLVFFALTHCSNTKFANAGIFGADIRTSTTAISMVSLDTGIEIYQKNNKKRMFPASTTKIMTYIIVAETISDFEGTKITVKEEDMKELGRELEISESALSKIKSGETYSVKRLLECMMIPSGNDAAFVLARHCSKGNVSAFVEKMNEKAIELTCEDTHFMNVHGWHNEEHYTTSDDMVKITRYARTLPFFQEIVKKTEVFVRDSDKEPLATTNDLIDKQRGGKRYYPYATGIKTGWTDRAGRCLISSAEKNGQSYLCVILGDFAPKNEDKRYIDSKNLYNWAFENIVKKQIIDKKKLIGEIRVNYAWKKDSLPLVPSEDFTCILPKSVDKESVNIKLNAPESVDAPIKAGDKICTATLTYANQELGTIDIVAMSTVERSDFLFVFLKGKEILSSAWFVVGSFLFLISLSGYIVLTLIHNKNKEMRRNNTRKYKKYKSEQEKHR